MGYFLGFLDISVNGINPVFESVDIEYPDVSRLNDTDREQVLTLDYFRVRIGKRPVSFKEKNDSVKLFLESPDCSRMKSFTEGNMMNVFFFSGCGFIICRFFFFFSVNISSNI